VISVAYQTGTKWPQSTAAENIAAERTNSGGNAGTEVNSQLPITFNNNDNFRRSRHAENGFSESAGGAKDIRTITTPICDAETNVMEIQCVGTVVGTAPRVTCNHLISMTNRSFSGGAGRLIRTSLSLRQTV
jgi:hypothetical protein